MVEEMLTEHDAVQPEAVSAVMGAVGVSVFGVWQIVYTAPRAEVALRRLEPITFTMCGRSGGVKD